MSQGTVEVLAVKAVSVGRNCKRTFTEVWRNFFKRAILHSAAIDPEIG